MVEERADREGSGMRDDIAGLPSSANILRRGAVIDLVARAEEVVPDWVKALRVVVCQERRGKR